LSNNHVIAASNAATLGDAILQPSAYDGGQYPNDVIAHLSRYVPIKFHFAGFKPCNNVDAAIAEGDLQDLNREVYWVGYLKRLGSPAGIGGLVQKTGRTTGYTTGSITNINATIDVDFPGGKIARFCQQIGATYMSNGGDSGSIVSSRDREALGLLFADSLLQSHSFMNPIQAVEQALGIRVTE
jgi:hypothetical protein